MSLLGRKPEPADIETIFNLAEGGPAVKSGVRGLSREQLCRITYDQLSTSADLEEGLKKTFRDLTGKEFDESGACVTPTHVAQVMKKLGKPCSVLFMSTKPQVFD